MSRGGLSKKHHKPSPADRDRLLSLLDPELRVEVESNNWTVYEGQSAARPVILDQRGHMVKGSGRWPAANDIAEISRKTAYKRTNTFREALEALVSLDGGPDDRGSFAWLVTQGLDIIEERRDPNLTFKLIELLAGKARETQDVNVKSQQWISVLNERIPVSGVEVWDVTAEERTIRETQVKNQMQLESGSADSA